MATCVREIRRALDDDPAAPHYIQTVHRRGYRYTGAHAQARTALDSLLVGRNRELSQLARCLGEARQGIRKLILITG